MYADSLSFFRRFAVLAAVLAVSACGWAEFPAQRGGPTSANRPPAGSDAFINATAVRVGKGDTVYSIARRHKLSPRDIIEANDLRPPYELQIGQRLVLPQGRVHTVQKGEYLSLIGRRYGVDAFAIARINGIAKPYTIYPGQQLRIPRGGTQTASAPPPPRSAPAGDVQSAPTDPAPDSTTSSTTRTASRPNAADVPDPPSRSGRFSWPLKGRILSGYGPKEKGLHNDGINIEVARGTEVRAAENGVVAYAGNEIRGFGNLVLIKHDGGWVTAYAHNDQLLVKRGEKVTRGQVISKAGSTGSVTSPQLHFELRRGANAVDPQKHLM